MAGRTQRQGTRRSRTRTAAASLRCCLRLRLSLGACTDLNRFQLTTATPEPTERTRPQRTPVQQTAATEREHERILASYGGVYEDARLSALISKAVDKLVAACERPDLSYKVTILNSPAINAFALADRPALHHPRPDRAGQRHLRTVFGAVARDGACDRAPCGDPRGSGAPGGDRQPRRHRHRRRSRTVGAGAGALEADAGELLARAGVRGGRHRRRHRRARRLRPVRRGALPDLDGAQRRAAGCPQRQRSALARFPVLASGDARARAERAGQCAAILHRRAPASATARAISMRWTT